MKNSIRIHAGLLATTAGCVQNTRPRIKADTKPVTVMLSSGQLDDDGSQLVLWSHLKGGTYDIEAAFDHRSISREAAEQRLRVELAQHGMRVTEFLDKERTTALAAALWIARYGYSEAMASPNPAARLDDMCDAMAEAWDDTMPHLAKFAGKGLEFAEVMRAAVADRLWAFNAIEYARAEAADHDCGYLFDYLAELLKKGADPHIIRRDALAAPRRLREIAEQAGGNR
ncbi:hypothetical protein ABZ517_29425 [Streptomyces scabiei]|uniref:hypothetical protein n=1 Tax=Streptomyces scabiei TaxID=1930 RepID=UPI00340C0AB8